MKKTIVVSDLDGTLLDGISYSFADALPALEVIHARGVPLVLCSSKTRAEIEVCRARMGNAHPFVVENGGGIFIPRGYFSTVPDASDRGGYLLISLGLPYEDIRLRFEAIRRRLGVAVRGFGDMTVEEVACLTGLSRADALLAKQRDFDEPFVFDGVPEERFLQAIEEAGLNWTQGRIFHVMGKHDKGRAVDILKRLYEEEYGAISSIGLGDGFNDLPLLRAVDFPVLVRQEGGECDSRIVVDGLRVTRGSGPRGWNETMLELLAAVPVEGGRA